MELQRCDDEHCLATVDPVAAVQLGDDMDAPSLDDIVILIELETARIMARFHLLGEERHAAFRFCSGESCSRSLEAARLLNC